MTVEEIESYMDKAYARYVEDHAEADLSRLTVVICKEDFDTIESEFLKRKDVKGLKARLVGYNTVNAPWGFKLIYREEFKSPQVAIVEL